VSEQNPTYINLSSADVLKSLEEKGLSLSEIKLKAVRLLFRLEYEGRTSKRPVRIELTTNSKAALPITKEGKMIEDYLKKQKVLNQEITEGETGE